MSNRAGGRHTAHLDSATEYLCGWFLCTAKVTHRFWREGIFLCQDHILETWALVERMQAEGRYVGKPKEPFTPPPASEREGSVYYIRIGDRVKIGFTTDLDRRLATYPPNMEILLIRKGSRDLEHQEHIRFSEHRTDGREWFLANERVLQMISEITEDIDRDWEPEWFKRRTHQPQTLSYRKLSSERVGHGH